MPQEEHERFFRSMLSDIDEPTTPFGLSDVHRDGNRVTEFHRMLPQTLNDRLRLQARRWESAWPACVIWLGGK